MRKNLTNHRAAQRAIHKRAQDRRPDKAQTQDIQPVHVGPDQHQRDEPPQPFGAAATADMLDQHDRQDEKHQREDLRADAEAVVHDRQHRQAANDQPSPRDAPPQRQREHKQRRGAEGCLQDAEQLEPADPMQHCDDELEEPMDVDPLWFGVDAERVGPQHPGVVQHPFAAGEVPEDVVIPDIGQPRRRAGKRQGRHCDHRPNPGA